jgi:Tfp pilus assembly protein PilP
VFAPAASAPALSESLPLAPALPALKLAGVAEDPGAEGPIRTAIISGEGQLYMVKEGENVTPRYRVVQISAEVVELLDVIDNSTRRLALR